MLFVVVCVWILPKGTLTTFREALIIVVMNEYAKNFTYIEDFVPSSSSASSLLLLLIFFLPSPYYYYHLLLLVTVRKMMLT